MTNRSRWIGGCFTHSLQNNWGFGLSLSLLAKYRTDLHNLSSLPIKIVKLRQKESNSSKNAYMIKKRIQQPNNRRGSIAGMYRRVGFWLDFHFQHSKKSPNWFRSGVWALALTMELLLGRSTFKPSNSVTN